MTKSVRKQLLVSNGNKFPSKKVFPQAIMESWCAVKSCAVLAGEGRRPKSRPGKRRSAR